MLFGGLIALEKRVRAFRSRLSNSEIQSTALHELFETRYDEVISQCVSLSEHVVSSIEDWTDILPEGSIVSEIGALTKLKEELQEHETEVDQLTSKLKEQTKLSSDEKRKLEKQLADHKSEIQKLKANRVPAWDSSNFSSTSGVALGPTGPSGPMEFFTAIPSAFSLGQPKDSLVTYFNQSKDSSPFGTSFRVNLNEGNDSLDLKTD